MFKNQPGQFITFQAILKASGDDGTALTPNVAVEIDGAGSNAGAGTLTEVEKGRYRYAPSQAETNGDHVTFSIDDPLIISQALNVYPIDVNAYKATGFSTFDPATDTVANVTNTASVTNPVTTDAASRTASQADVSNLDVEVSSRMPTTHIAATAGKVDGVGTVDTTTTNTDMRGTDNAATAASQTAQDAEIAKVIKSGEAADYAQNSALNDTNVNVTVTRS